MGYIVVLLLIALPIIGVIARIQIRNYQNRAIENGRAGSGGGAKGAAAASNPAFSKEHQSLATAVEFQGDITQVAQVLAGVRLPLLWEKGDGYTWTIQHQKGVVSGQAKLEHGPHGAPRLELIFSPDLQGLAQEANSWKSLRGKAIKAASAQGISASEVQLAPAVRVPAVDPTGLTPEQVANLPHRWVRAAGF